ncbi:polysaccharide deacetylase family protein [Bacteroides bouchesdurhonensis]|uniref:polysaccharide deacetylase family protein n=1 Tax=Bacteroides bouchesdurhonensis TaxID=1841855 RepID=UPI00097F7364|nr:polysaccharide deacetylase family protein [Bacteroides bouchesdurhonensis]
MILLSFDIEEFDVPKEHQVDISLEEQIRVSSEGTSRILDCLKRNQVKATFFCTANFALHAPEIIRRIQMEGHEIASHGFYHWTFNIEDLKKSKEQLEEMTGLKVFGYRQARMMPVSEKAIYEAGYTYNSSLNPTFIPGRYMRLSTPRTYFMKENVLQIPTSVTPLLRFPLFWLSCHNLPAGLYRYLCKYTHNHDGYFVTYFHPWEFYPLNEHPEWKLPFIIRNHAGKGMEKRLDDFIRYFKKQDIAFSTFIDYIKLNVKPETR